MTQLTDLTITQAIDGLKAKSFTAVELTEAHIEMMQGTRALNAFSAETPEMAIEQAKAADGRYQKGEPRIFDGIPIGMKDLFCTKGVLTQAASKILNNFTPPYESTVSQNLLNHGAVVLGKLNMDEFAMGSANLNSVYGPALNPWKGPNGEALVPGGSSGGSSAAVAARSCMGATGTDTGGSIRQPAAFTGIVGIKPTYGRCSRWGIVAFASSLDQAGPMTRTVADSALMLQAMAGHDPKDATSSRQKTPDFMSAFTGDIRGLKIGVPKEYRVDGMPREIEEIWQKGIEMMKSAGAEIHEISLPHTKYALPCYYIIAPAEASSNLARYDGVRYGLRVSDDKDSLTDMYEKTRGEGFGAEVKRRIMIGTYVLSAGYYDAYYRKAQRVRTLISQDFKEAYKKVDVILTPTTPSAAFSKDNPPKDPVSMYLNDVFTVPANLAGLPGISIPVALNKDGLPLGLQILGKAFDEMTVFRAAGVLESLANYTARPDLSVWKEAA